MYSILPGFVIAALVQTIGQQVKDTMKLRTLGYWDTMKYI